MTAETQRHIAINGRFLDTAMTGVQRYAWEIVRALDRLIEAGDPSVRGLTISLLRPESDVALPGPLTHIRQRQHGRRGGHYWEQVTLPRMAAGARLLNLCNLGPLAYRDAIICVHDAHIWLVPENYSFAFRTYYKIMLPLLLRTSRKWTTVSHYSEEQLRYFGVANRPADGVIGNAVGEIGHLTPRKPVRPDIRIPDRFVFALGSVAKNKNIALLERIAPRLADSGIAVVTAGGSNTAIFRDDGEDVTNVTRLGRVDDAELAWLYRHALCFAFPSFYEGFGIPPLEAMACSCPVVSSNTSALPEVLGKAPLWADPRDPDRWCAAIIEIANDPGLRETLAGEGLQHAGRWSWEESARAYAELARA